MNKISLSLAALALLPLSLTMQSSWAGDQKNTATNANQRVQTSVQTSAQAAFKRGDFQEALRLFDQLYRQAKAPQLASANLLYNRAVCLFKLQRLTEARQAFSELAQRQAGSNSNEQQWAELAHYNLALIAQSQGDKANAKAEFTLLAQTASNDRLKLLAQRQLANLKARENQGHAAANRPPPKTSALLLSLAATSDDNAGGFADELANELSNARDNYLTALAYGQAYLSGQPSQGFKLYGLAQQRRYQRFNSFDTQVLGVGLDSEFKYGDWNLSLGGRWLNTQVDGAALYNQLSLLSKGSRPLGAGKLELAYSASHFSAGKNYRYLDGWQHQVRASWTLKTGSWQLSPNLGWETNSRSDKRTESQFFSYSPQILSLGLGIKYTLDDDWQLYAQGDLASASYSGTNKMKDLGDKEKQQQRDYTRTNLLLGARYQITRHWQLKGEYQQIASDDSFALYSYDKQLLNLKLDYLW